MTEVLAPGDRFPWEPQPGETSKSFAAFAVYRDLGPRRSLAKAAQVLIEQGVRKGTARGVASDLAEWSVKHGWVDRVVEYDLYTDRRLREENESELRQAARRQADLGVGLQIAVSKRLRGYASEEEQVNRIDPNEMDWTDVAQLTRIGVNVERLARGQPTDVLQARQAFTASEVNDLVTGIFNQVVLPIMPPELHDRLWEAWDRFVNKGLGVEQPT